MNKKYATAVIIEYVIFIILLITFLVTDDSTPIGIKVLIPGLVFGFISKIVNRKYNRNSIFDFLKFTDAGDDLATFLIGLILNGLFGIVNVFVSIPELIKSIMCLVSKQ